MLGTHFTLLALSIAVALFAALLAMVKAGRRFGMRAARDGDRGQSGLGGAEGAVYGLMGLLIAFSFSGAASRFEKRRELLVAEANAIGTAYLRVDLLRAEHQPAIRAVFRQYLDSRLAAYRKLPDMCTALFIAVMSFFLGQSQVFPYAVRTSGLLAVPGIVVATLLVFWLVRVLFTRKYRSATPPATLAIGHPAT